MGVSSTRSNRTIQFFMDPKVADLQERDRLLAMNPQDRLNEMLELVERWNHCHERRFERILEIVEF